MALDTPHVMMMGLVLALVKRWEKNVETEGTGATASVHLPQAVVYAGRTAKVVQVGNSIGNAIRTAF